MGVGVITRFELPEDVPFSKSNENERKIKMVVMSVLASIISVRN